MRRRYTTGRLSPAIHSAPVFDLAKARLEALGKPVPQVDTQLAAQNQARVNSRRDFLQ